MIDHRGHREHGEEFLGSDFMDHATCSCIALKTIAKLFFTSVFSVPSVVNFLSF